MPQISKVRIVNFKYNKGRRMIADELYDFADSQNERAFNVLINLENGGGKSVLVQLMMQPVIPKARVAGRKIESFFDQNSDHCFVLLEWFKDNSPEKLLTGIAMSASESNGMEDEQERGRSVKYYTFYSNYRMYNSRYDIVNMPLSKRENGRFIAADFDEVRRLSRQSNGVLQYYSSDDRVKWKKKLAEYGLIQDEWHLAETLNSVEGGLGKFFERFKSSDALVDQLMIKTIEDKIGQGAENPHEDASLSSMLMAYARQYAGKQDVLREQKNLRSFVEDMDHLQPRVEELSKAKDKMQEAIRDLFGMSGALAVKLQELQANEENLDGQIQKADEDFRHVEWETASQAFYEAQESFKQAQGNYEAAENRFHTLNAEKEQTTHRMAVLECARQYEKLTEINAKIKAVGQEIDEKQKGSDGSDQLLRYKYSTLTAVNRELDTCINEWKKCRAKLEDARKEKQENQISLKKAQNELNKAKTAYDRKDGECRLMEDQTDRLMEELGEGIVRRLDGYYPQDELDEYAESIQNEKQTIRDALIENRKRQEEIQRKLDAIPDQKAQKQIEQNQLKQDSEKIEQAVSDYDEQEARMAEICAQYNLDFEGRFTGRIADYLESEKKDRDAEYNGNILKISIAGEEIRAAENGYLHVPRSVIDYLNSTGIPYDTCEKYLLLQVKNGKLTRERLSEILENYPAAAYGILLTDEEKRKLFEFDRADWLPSMIPLFNYKQMDQILRVEKKFDGSLAFYAKEYFSDTEHYSEHLLKQRDGMLKRQGQLHSEIQQLQKQIDQACAFNYAENWKSEQEAQLGVLRQKIADVERDIQILQNQKAKLEQERGDIRKAEDDLNNQKQSLLKREQLLGQIQKNVQTEKTLGDDRSELYQKNRDADDLVEEAREAYDDACQKVGEAEQSVREIEERQKRLNEIQTAVDGCDEADVIEGRAEELYQTYIEMEKNLKAELDPLKEKLTYLSGQKEECGKIIRKKQVDAEEYQSVSYSEEQENALNERLHDVEKQACETQKNYHKCLEDKGREEGRFETAQTNLSPFGDALEKSEIAGHFDERKREIQAWKERLNGDIKRIQRRRNELSSVQDMLENDIVNEERPEKISDIALEDHVKQQYRKMKGDRDTWRKESDKQRSDMQQTLYSLQIRYKGTTCGVSDAVDGLLQLLESASKGDRYYTLFEHITEERTNARRAISQIETDLREFENQRLDLIRHCMLQGKCIYDGLNQMAASSKVTVYDGKPKQQMIRFNIPNEVDLMRTQASIEHEIELSVQEIVRRMAESDTTEADIQKQAEHVVSSARLLRKYIGQDSVQVQAYKIDQNPQNAEYRTWEQTQVNNSGAEKFVVYFAVILSVMNYTRSEVDGVNDKDLRSTLILDNPFGATSSKHILEPMFAIAKHFRVQLVCLSDINKAEIINCFETVIKAIVKRKPASNNEILTHEGNETIEHGFYRAEQISI